LSAGGGQAKGYAGLGESLGEHVDLLVVARRTDDTS